MLPSRWGRRGRKLTSSETTKVVGLAKAEAAEQVGSYRLKPMLPRHWGRIGRRMTGGEASKGVGLSKAEAARRLGVIGLRLTSSGTMMAVRLAEVNAAEPLGPYRSKANK